MASVTLKNIVKKYPGGVTAVANFNLDVKDEEFIVLVGPSGCGKTTTLRMIAGLEEITEGELYIADRLVNDVAPKDRDIAMVFQNYALYPHMTVFDNMAFGLKLRKMPKDEIKAKVEEAARILDITHLLERKPSALSGGQKQRVALGRAIVRNPKVFLLDEPLSNLDAKLRAQMRTELTKLHQKLAATFVYVTHDQVEAMTMADRIVVMKDGFIQQVDTPAYLYSKPSNLFVAGFLGSPKMNTWNVKVTEFDGGIYIGWGEVKMKLPDSKAKISKVKEYIGKELVVGVRPEDMYEDEYNLERYKDFIMEADVEVAELMGAEIYLYFVNEGNDYTARVAPSCPARTGDKIKIAIDPDKIHLFDPDTEVVITN